MFCIISLCLNKKEIERISKLSAFNLLANNEVIDLLVQNLEENL